MSKTNKHKARPSMVVAAEPDPFAFVEKYQNVLFWAIMGITALCAALLFNFRIDEGGDDSTYICRAVDLVNEGKYPTYQGPLYPMFLALFVALSGVNLVVLKLTSFVLILAAQYVFYRVLRNGVNIRLLFTVMTLLGINSWYLFFASQTYSEALFILVQYLFFGFVMRFEDLQDGRWKKLIISSLPSAALVVAAFLIRTVGGGFGLIGVVYLCLRKQFRKALVFLGSIIVIMLVWAGIRTAIWGDVGTGGQQMEMLFQKHPYQISDGQETPSGFIVRFIDNSKLYVSKHLMRIAGFKDATNRDTSLPVTVVVYALFIFGAVVAYKRNRYVFFMALCSGIMLGITFFALQKLWDQYRLIIPYLAMAYMVIFYGIYQLFRLLTKKHAHKLALIVAAFSGVMSLSQTYDKIHLDTLLINLSGDRLYGYTPDWYNYLKLCQLTKEDLPGTSYVACRKPNMARIYADGKKFYGIYNFTSQNADTLINNLRNQHVTHVIAASLRRDPQYPGRGVINTIHRYMNFVMKKYPHAFRPLLQQGATNYEPAYLFAVDYEYVDRVRTEGEPKGGEQ